MNKEVRVRFAPSPTGGLHIGGVRTALYNYLFAKKMGGKMLLRIEDTDQARFVPGAEDYIMQALEWVGIKIDEGVREGGPFAPYKQSERKSIYKEYAMKLVNEGNAYYAFDSNEELDAMRKRMEASSVSFAYNSITRAQLKNSLTLSEDEVKRKLEAGDPFVIRLKVPRKDEIRINDLVRGWVMVHSSAVDDKVLMKSDGMPTYHLANVVDDHLMKISHVIRGEEWLPSAPVHVLLYKFLGWEETMPQFAHLPLILKPNGNGKLSKRDAEAGGFPIFPLEWNDPNSGITAIGYREEGYLPEAMVNFLAFQGWNPGTPQEMFSMAELIQAFTIERIGKSGTKFDINKAKWFNQQYMKQKSAKDLSVYLTADLKAKNISCEQSKLEKISELLKERIVFAKDLWNEGKFFFEAPVSYDESILAAKWTGEAVKVINEFAEALTIKSSVNAEEAKAVFNDVLEKNGVKMGKVLQALRLALTGVGAGPDLMQIIELLGKEESVKRIKTALSTLTKISA
jgi:glutamyl-tRNA synthetase